MRISEIRIRGFRSFVDLTIPIDPETTVVVGENNAGKSAVLDALRFALPPRGTGRRALVLTDYDFHLANKEDDPHQSSPIVIEVEFRESKPDEWPENLSNELNEVIQTEPDTNIDYIHLRFQSQYNASSKSYESTWQFLDASRNPQSTGRAAAPGYFSNFSRYIVVFYLSALRDAYEEFSSRSQFWGQILRAVDIPEANRIAAEKEIDRLNTELLALDPSLQNITNTLQRIEKVMIQGVNQSVTIRALPIRAMDLLARSEIAVQGRGSNVNFPLTRHGQGMQSISVYFLFQAFVESTLATVYKNETEPVLCLEEPEAHLHPQAVRALWAEMQATTTQSILTTHSPYLVQNVPLKKLRLLRKTGEATAVAYLKDSFAASLTKNDALDKVLKKYPAKYSYSDVRQTLSVNGVVTNEEYRELLACYPNAPANVAPHSALKSLKLQSQSFVGSSDLERLQNNAQRLRGEIFFSRGWLLCEGQSDYIVLHLFAEILGIPLDAHNVSVIDYQNNGSPGQFASLARAFSFPWHLICDNDEGGDGHIKELANRHFNEGEVKKRTHPLPAKDLEAYLVSAGFRDELTTIAQGFTKEDLGALARDANFDQKVAALLRQRKGEWPLQLAIALREGACHKSRVPQVVEEVIKTIVSEANA